ncbi:MAG: UvrD-helicase domain-containing protein [Lachnospiraceae bacterium]|nr:UvrD-helicase domain-containing protein [Candidatus Colinaster scatohippi]
MQFNSEQLKAIRHGEGPALVIAGPGSGKTSVLTNRIKNLIEEYKVNPENILVITFSKAASVEMQNRFINLCGKEFYSVNFGTFHSVFFQIIHSVYNYNTNNILNLRQKRELMLHAIKATGVLENPENEFVDTLLNEVSGYMNSNEMAKINSATNISTEQFLMIYREYGHSKKSIGKIDFEDMLVIVRDLFRERRSVLDEYRKRFKYILIDEYQDINSIQYDIVKMLAGTSANLWVCGDIGTYLIYRRTIRVHCNMA